ncbi:MAG: hypothetical protein IPM42_17870 [Saprospiraceae bacterium]|nr:hypothetical protein [Saprospiraceae bacterium]
MKIAKLAFVIVAASAIFQMFLPWWIIAPIAFGACYFSDTGKFMAFGTSFLAVFILWFFAARFAERSFDVSMAETIGNIMGGISAQLIFFLTALIGGLTAGISALSGRLFYELLNNKS